MHQVKNKTARTVTCTKTFHILFNYFQPNTCGNDKKRVTILRANFQRPQALNNKIKLVGDDYKHFYTERESKLHQ